jgi:Holliday junction DNA helicase RuvB
MDLKENAARMIANNPQVRSMVARALEVEEAGRLRQQELAIQYKMEAGNYLGWAWSDIPVPAARLRTLVEEGVMKIGYQSRSCTNYLVADPEMARQVLAQVAAGAAVGDVPDSLFDYIVGHDNEKYWLTKSLHSEEPVHMLLAGPPATAKSLFLEAVGSLQGAQFALGGSASKAGIADFLLNFQPRYLIIDELDKMSAQDYSVLLSLMQSGTVSKLKKGMRANEQMTTWVFAGVNRKDRLPPELLSRFIIFDFLPYTETEYLEVAVAIITRQMGKDQDLAEYIARQVGSKTRDVRQAVQVAKLVDSKEEVDRFIAGSKKKLI